MIATNLFAERRRSLAVKGLGVLDKPAEPAFKAGHGLTLTCIQRSAGFCGYALDHSGALECYDPVSPS